MRIAFFAATPFQVFNCINIYKRQFCNTESDIFILTFAVDMSSLVEELKLSNVFSNVYLLDKINVKPGKFGVIKDFIFTDRSNLQMLMEHKYDIMFTTYIGDRSNLYYNVLLKENKNLKVYFYDEGIGVYTVGYYCSSKLMKLFYRLMGLRYINKYYEKVYVYAPQCMCSGINETLVKIPAIDKNDCKIVESYNRIFRVNIDYSQKYKEFKCIYLDQDFSRYMEEAQYCEEYRFSQLDILNELTNGISKGKIIVKKHPIRRDKVYEDSGYTVEERLELPWEIVQLNENFSSKVLIGINSTALLSPKMIYDEEPYVIVLGKMIRNEGLSDRVWTSNIEELFVKVQNMYGKKEKFLIVESMQEYIKLVEIIGKL